jgi:hypothetical protein
MRKLYTFVLAAALAVTTTAQTDKKESFWTPVGADRIKLSGERVIIPRKYATFRLVNDNLKKALWTAPHEKKVRVQDSPTIIELPLPDGTLKKFRVVESPVMAPELCAAYPNIKTFNVVGVDLPGTYGKLDFTEMGFHAMLRGSLGDYYIDPYCRFNQEDYSVYYVKDFRKDPAHVMEEVGVLTNERPLTARYDINTTQAVCVGSQLRTYRTAIACTGEYAQAATGLSSPTVAQALSCIVTTLNRVDGVYETDLAVKMVLVPTETVVVYTNPSTDPFTGNNNASTLIGQSQTVIDNNIGNANYDNGHTFSTGGGGLSTLGGICTAGQKARSITGSPAPTGDPYDIDYVAHEMGHNFDGNHTFRGASGSCAGNYNPGTMVEPGSGITIQAYAGICGTNNDSTNSIPYFHTISYDEMINFTVSGNGNSCANITSTGNNAPTVVGSANYVVPKSTPFILTGSATDPDGDVLSYSWEEIDNNSTAGNWNSGSRPFFRNYNPSSSSSRMFPRLSVVQSGTYTTTVGEYLPSTQQTLNFRLVARDNKMGGGGVCYAASSVTVSSTAGPLTVTYPNVTGISWASGSSQTVTWDVNGTTASPVNCSLVNLLISYNSGSTWTMLMPGVANSGTQVITVPTVTANIATCRIKVESVGNIFFDMSDKNFTITTGGIGISSAYSGGLAVQLVPNPAGNAVNVQVFGLRAAEKHSLVIYDMLGNALLKDVLSGKESYDMHYDLSSFARGVYLVEISGDNRKAVSRLVKQ